MLLTVLFVFVFTSSISDFIFLEPTSTMARVVVEAIRLKEESVMRTTDVVVFISFLSFVGVSIISRDIYARP